MHIRSQTIKKNIIVRDQEVLYVLRKTTRARRMRLAVHRDGAVVVTTPFRLPEYFSEKFIQERAQWVLSRLILFQKYKDNPIINGSYEAYVQNKAHALAIVKQKADYFADRYGLIYNSITVRNQRTCWGSCSKKGNLNFNYKIVFLPEKIQNYVVVHELCHLKEFNHSKRFWALVAHAVPDHREVRHMLRQAGAGRV